ncbi:hypothetical protein NC652_026268 [Populus alba x Populus x berolinensis]|nr:hypothetical protein NC652_026268 [Populus alba x Populus x berolinensis]
MRTPACSDSKQSMVFPRRMVERSFNHPLISAKENIIAEHAVEWLAVQADGPPGEENRKLKRYKTINGARGNEEDALKVSLGNIFDYVRRYSLARTTPSELMLGATYGLMYPGLGYACLRGRCRQKQKVTCLDGLMRTMLSAFTSVLSPFPWHLRV